MNQFKAYLKNITPITDQEFEASIPLFKLVDLKKGEYFVKENIVCKRIGYIISGTIRIFYHNQKAEETTYGFCQADCLTTSFKSFVFQQPSQLILQ